MSLFSLPPGAAHLWYVDPDAIDDWYLRAAYHSVMSPEEARQQARFRFLEGRQEYLVTRALVRAVLSAYTPVAPRDWLFVRNGHGRPEIAGPKGAPRLRFNLSNTRGLVACLVARDREVGLDVEDTHRRGETVSIADRFFSPFESAALRRLPVHHQRDRFFDYWTLKEAYIKARGMGLAIPLDHFSYHLDEGGPIRISFEPELRDDPSRWQFSLTSLGGRHRVATAIERRPGEGTIAVEMFRCLPFEDVPPKA
ncbi:4'-phosphopantetheinyl transferase superfamily protein [Polyangium sp. 6x1]|uniref:4'-phosphopantetheinyl transferase family protein n=1 Tax=Polyangium sp. 6x1 TaxID=3042689 RepID=UPI002482E986|nr:4'-phosphopantetheinyl transferase superfamily protein [Polyangium sp. 6x1]MDI1450260.1 4'-phosphopantetheinyl transferase superfamily protein [Polyangium sp. 6x1]